MTLSSAVNGFLGAILGGLALGMAYGLIAVGYSLVFGILRLVNFAHGAIYALGAYGVFFLTSRGMGLLPALILAALLSGLGAWAVEKWALAPLRRRGASGMAQLVTTVGVSFLVQNTLAAEAVFGSEKQVFPSLNVFGSVQVFGVTIQSSQIIMFLAAMGLLLALTWLVQGTRLGLAMRACAQNFRAARLVGIPVEAVVGLTFFLGGACAAIAGTLIGGYYQVISPTMGSLIGLKAFSAAVVGGIGVLHGAVAGGLVVGVGECLAAQYLGSNVRDPMAFVLLIAILLVRPRGLFGREGVEKV